MGFPFEFRVVGEKWFRPFLSVCVYLLVYNADAYWGSHYKWIVIMKTENEREIKMVVKVNYLKRRVLLIN